MSRVAYCAVEAFFIACGFEHELLHAPGFDLADDDLVGVAAIHHVDHLEAAELLAGMAELADDRAVQLHLVDLAGDRPAARQVAVGLELETNRYWCGPSDTQAVQPTPNWS